MANRIVDISLRQAARVAGFALLISFIVGIFAFESFAVPGDARVFWANRENTNIWEFRLYSYLDRKKKALL